MEIERLRVPRWRRCLWSEQMSIMSNRSNKRPKCDHTTAARCPLCEFCSSRSSSFFIASCLFHCQFFFSCHFLFGFTLRTAERRDNNTFCLCLQTFLEVKLRTLFNTTLIMFIIMTLNTFSIEIVAIKICLPLSLYIANYNEYNL